MAERNWSIRIMRVDSVACTSARAAYAETSPHNPSIIQVKRETFPRWRRCEESVGLSRNGETGRIFHHRVTQGFTGHTLCRPQVITFTSIWFPTRPVKP